ncbi:YczE/YyaS/YitT family protein [Brevibacillus sp. B_LB10_24]|uniref:YczE/YyaS/YitT family protein n=1 Tax=Brevibacillus sp. B_LB10_24 TaxID=3380645 RepID=UPI0038B8596B
MSEKGTKFTVRCTVFLAGLFVLALGVVFMMQAKLGVASWDVLHIGLTHLTALSMGTWIQIIGILMIWITCVLDRKWPRIGSVLNIVLIGYFVNWLLALDIVPAVELLWARILMLVFGIVLMGFGAGMYVASNIGAGPRDGLTLLLAERSGWSIRLVRTILEGTALLLGWLATGPVSVGTFVSVLMVGPVMQASLRFWRKQMEKLAAAAAS